MNSPNRYAPVCQNEIYKNNISLIEQFKSGDTKTKNIEQQLLRLKEKLNIYLPTINELFDTQNYFKICLAESSSDDEKNEFIASVRMLGNLFHSIMAQKNECALHEELSSLSKCQSKTNSFNAINNDKKIGFAESQGRRQEMEDRYSWTQFDIAYEEHRETIETFGIYDGHTGVNAANYTKSNLDNNFKLLLQASFTGTLTATEIRQSLISAFEKTHNDFQELSGTTVVYVAIIAKKIYIANAGDARCALLAESGPNLDNKIIALTEDAKPNKPRFQKKVFKLDGKLMIEQGVMRVRPGFAMTRVIGDKKRIEDRSMQTFVNTLGLSCIPKISCFPLEEITKGYLLLTCDGPFECNQTTNSVGQDIFNQIKAKEGKSLKEIAEIVVNNSINKGSYDNQSVMLVQLHQ